MLQTIMFCLEASEVAIKITVIVIPFRSGTNTALTFGKLNRK